MTIAKRLAAGTSYLTLSNGVIRLLSIVSMPILTSLLSPAAYGVAALFGTMISLVSVFALAGIDMSYTRAYHSAKPPCGNVVEHYCWRLASIAAMVVALLTAMGWWFFNRHSASQFGEGLAILLAVGIVFSVIHTMAQTRARLASRYRAMSLASVTTGIVSPLAAIGIAVWWRQDALALLLPMLLSYLLPVLVLGLPPISGLLRPSELTWHEGVSVIKVGLAGVVTAPMYWLLSSSDRWFLQYYHGAEAVGVYSIGYNVAIVGMMVNTAVMSVWLPEASREFEQDQERAKVTLGRLMSRLVAVMAIIWLIVSAAGGDIIRWLANERFHAATDYVCYIAAGVFFYGIMHLANTGLLLAKKLHWAALWWLGGGLVSILLNLALVPAFGGLGAAVTQTISFTFISLGILMTAQAIFRVVLDWTRLTSVMLIIFCSGILLATPWHSIPALSLLMKLPIGIAVAAIVTWLMAEDWCVQGFVYLRRRLIA